MEASEAVIIGNALRYVDAVLSAAASRLERTEPDSALCAKLRLAERTIRDARIVLLEQTRPEQAA